MFAAASGKLASYQTSGDDAIINVIDSELALQSAETLLKTQQRIELTTGIPSLPSVYNPVVKSGLNIGNYEDYSNVWITRPQTITTAWKSVVYAPEIIHMSL